jgi:hypothetical protein
MPSFPALSQVSTTHLDAGTDEPRLARSDIKQSVDNVNSIVSTFSGKVLPDTATEQGWTRQQYFELATVTDGSNITWNCETQQVAQITLGGNRNLLNPQNQQAGAVYTLIVKQDATGSRTLAFGTDYKFPNGVDPVLSTQANAIDILSFISDGTYMYGAISRNFQ